MSAAASGLTETGMNIFEEAGEEENTEEATGEHQTDEALDEEASTAPAESVSPVPSAIPSGTPSATPVESPEATDVPSELPSGTETPTATPESSEAPSLSPDEAASPSETAASSELPSETPSATPDEETPEELSAETDLAGAEKEYDRTIMDEGLAKVSDDFLEVDESGVLKLKDGKEIYGSTIKIPKEAKVIPEGFFAYQTSVKYITFEEGSKLTTIGKSAFERCGVLSMVIPEGVTEIGDYVFKNSGLTQITFEGVVTSIGKEAFSGTDLGSVSAPDVTTVKESAFSTCTSLTTVNMPKLTTIGESAFQYCTKLNAGMVWGSRLTNIAADAFKGCGFTNLDMSAVSGEITIAASAFENCTKLTSVILPSGLKEISTALFKGCTLLSSVSIPNSAEVINEEAFSGCISLKRIGIAEAVRAIRANAFAGCSALTAINILNETPTGDDFVIAQNAFPNRTDNSKITMKGYDGKVQEYAESRGYTYESLFDKYDVLYEKNANVDLVVNTNRAIAGEEILVTVTTKSGYCLTGTGIEVKCDTQAAVNPELLSISGNKSVFRFTMPAGEATISVMTAKTSEISGTNMTFDFKAVNGFCGTYASTTQKLTIDKTGQATQVLVSLDGESIGAWNLKYSSSNANIVSISDQGVISAKKKGTAKITVALKDHASTAASFDVVVTEDAIVDRLDLDIGTPSRATLKTITFPDDSGVQTEYPVIEYNKTTLATGSRSFTVSFDALEKNSENNLLVSAKWTSVDSSIATVASATTTDNKNTITVKKGVEGETMVTVTVENADKTVCKQSFIVRVVDATPRLADSKISVNSNSSQGTVFDLVPVYGYKIDEENNMKVCKRVVSSGVVRYEPVNGLAIDYDYDSEEFRLRATQDLEIAQGKTLTYKGSSALYLQGEFEGTGDSFVVRIPELAITNKTLNPSLQSKGKINLFYSREASVEEQGSVTLTQSLKNETVESYQLVSEANYKKSGSEAEDSFAANFTVRKQEDGSALITRSNRETLVQVKGKNVVSGYLYIYYEGYTTPVKKKLTVPTCNTKPSLELSMSSATASTYRKDQSYTVYLRDKKTKQKYALDMQTKLSFDYTSTTDGLFKDASLGTGLTDGDIVIQVSGTPSKGKAVITVKDPAWGSALKYTFNLKTTSTHPAVKTSSTKLVLNTLCKDQPATLTATVSSTEASFAGFDSSTLKYSGNRKYQGDAEKLMACMESTENGLKVSLPEDEIKAMTYSFKVTPKLEYEGGLKYYGKQISFTVTVKDTKPSMKLAKSTFSLNVQKPGIETVKAAYSIQNMPEGVSYQIDAEDMILTPVKSGNNGARDMMQYIHVTVDETEGKLAVRLDRETPKTSFSYEYYVKGLKVKIGGQPVALNQFKIKVTGVNKAPSLSVSGKGTINPVNAQSSIVYTAKVNNMVSDIAEVKVWELKGDSNYYLDGEGSAQKNRTSEHFTVELNGNQAVVKVKEGVTLDASTTYRIKLAYVLAAVPDEYQATTKIFSIKPVQTLPKVKTDRSSAYLYAGQNRNKTVDIQLTKTSVTDAQIVDVVFAKNTPDSVKKSYQVSYDETTGMATLTLVNPAGVVLNKKYTITLETRCKNQMDNSTGTTFKIDVTVRK